MVHDFEFAAVEFAAKHGTFVRVVVNLAFVLDAKAAVADREVEAAIRPNDQAVHVVADQRGVHAVAFVHDDAFVGYSVVVAVAQFPQLRDVGDVDVVTDR